MYIAAVILVRYNTLPLHKLDLCNSMTIIVTHLTQWSKQEHNEFTGARPGITSKHVRLVTIQGEIPAMAAVPPANPTPQAPIFALGLGRDTTVLDWSIPADTKLYYKEAIAALDNKFDGTPEKFIVFLASTTSRA